MFSSSSTSTSRFSDLSPEYLNKLEEQAKSSAATKEEEEAWFFKENGGRTIVKPTTLQVYDCGGRIIDDRGDIWTMYTMRKPWKLIKGMGAGGMENITTEKELDEHMAKMKE